MSTTPTDAERALFEAWILTQGGSVDRVVPGEYRSAPTECAWMAWQAARALPVDGLDAWQPIETAPKDGTKLLGLVHFPGDDICKPFSEYSLIQWDKGFKSSICDRKPQWDKQFRGEVTHWQPLPRPPIAKQQEPS